MACAIVICMNIYTINYKTGEISIQDISHLHIERNTNYVLASDLKTALKLNRDYLCGYEVTYKMINDIKIIVGN